ncbi:MAG: UPF0149 family protein [Cellvibrionaceae bacterium]
MTDSSQPIDFDSWCNLLVVLDTISSPAELHGALVGMLCGGRSLKTEEWQAWALEFLDAQKEPQEDCLEALGQMLREAKGDLDDAQFGFNLLLPDDDTELAVRIHAMAEWCEGFLVGFGNAGIAEAHQFSDESAETLRDISSITQIADDELETDAENDLNELMEYLRVAAMNLYAEFNGEKPVSSTSKASPNTNLSPNPSSQSQSSNNSVANLFGKKLH